MYLFYISYDQTTICISVEQHKNDAWNNYNIEIYTFESQSAPNSSEKTLWRFSERDNLKMFLFKLQYNYLFVFYCYLAKRDSKIHFKISDSSLVSRILGKVFRLKFLTIFVWFLWQKMGKSFQLMSLVFTIIFMWVFRRNFHCVWSRTKSFETWTGT